MTAGRVIDHHVERWCSECDPEEEGEPTMIRVDTVCGDEVDGECWYCQRCENQIDIEPPESYDYPDDY